MTLEIMTVILRAALLGSVIFAALSFRQMKTQLTIAQKSFADDHELRRRQYSITILRGFSNEVFEYAAPLRKKWPSLTRQVNAKALTPKEATDLWHATEGEKVELRKCTVAMLNYMECICRAYEVHAVDRAIIRESFEGVFDLFFTHFEKFIVASREDLGDTHWRSIVSVIRDWRQLRMPEMELREQTGQA